jgi:hypothetical protein
VFLRTFGLVEPLTNPRNDPPASASEQVPTGEIPIPGIPVTPEAAPVQILQAVPAAGADDADAIPDQIHPVIPLSAIPAQLQPVTPEVAPVQIRQAVPAAGADDADAIPDQIHPVIPLPGIPAQLQPVIPEAAPVRQAVPAAGADDADAIPDQIHPVIPAAAILAAPQETILSYTETVGEETETVGEEAERCIFTIVRYPDMILGNMESPSHRIQCHYNLEGQLQHMVVQNPDNDLTRSFTLKDRDLEVVTIEEGGADKKTTHHMSENIPWVQEMMIGPREFALSNKLTFEFYFLLPVLGLMKMAATKGRSGADGLIEIKVGPSNRLYSWIASLIGIRGSFWYDQEGVMKKMIMHFPGQPSIRMQWRPNDP